jgi:hypothetical protein
MSIPSEIVWESVVERLTRSGSAFRVPVQSARLEWFVTIVRVESAREPAALQRWRVPLGFAAGIAFLVFSGPSWRSVILGRQSPLSACLFEPGLRRSEKTGN